MRFKPGGRWLPFTATQEYDVRRVGFRWRAHFPLAPLIWLSVIDELEVGVGSLEGRLWGAIRFMRASGDAVAKGEALRYLGELFWTPFSILANEELRWREIEDGAEVATAVGAGQVAIRLDFNTHGDIVKISTPARPRQVGTKTVDTPWRGEVTDYVTVGGIRIPRRAAVWWGLPEGAFRYWEGSVTGFEVEG